MSRYLLIAILFFKLIPLAQSQEEHYTPGPEEVEQYKAQSRALVAYFEGTLNFLGDPLSTTQEKEIVISESYTKIFASNEVQIEDDLDENREVPINKNVQAYLKDVDFFFRSAVFRFDVQTVEPMVGDNGTIFFKVTFMRQLDAVTINNDTIRSNKLRFMEINLDPFKKDLKIASYYTTKINEQDELRQWWSALPDYWKEIFGRDAVVFDSLLMTDIEGIGADKVLVRQKQMVQRKGKYLVAGTDTIPAAQAARLFNRKPDTVIMLDDYKTQWVVDSMELSLAVIDNRLKQIASTKVIDLSFNINIVDLEPLSQLNELEELNISNTPVNDLSPLRNLSKLKSLYLSSTLVRNLSPLQYCSNLQEIFFHDTEIEDMAVVEHFRNLEKLYCFNSGIRSLDALAQLKQLTVIKAGNTLVEDLGPLTGLLELRILDLSQTLITTLSPISGLTNLQQLNVDKTLVTDISPLAAMQQLNLLQISETKVTDLEPLMALEGIKRVYAEKNNISQGQAAEMMRKKPGLLVIFNSEELAEWWNALPIYWRAMLTAQSGLSGQPGNEELHQIVNIQKLNLSENTYIQQIDPVNRLVNLQELSLSKTEVTELTPLKALHNLRKLNLSQTRIVSLNELAALFQLEELNIENTRVERLDPLYNLRKLSLVRADNSRVSASEAIALKNELPDMRIVYQTGKLLFWWNNLDDLWQQLLTQDMHIEGTPGDLQLQAIADRKSLLIENKLEITNLEPLIPLLMLEKLVIKGSSVSDLNPLQQLTRLNWLELSGNPLSNLAPLSKLDKLTYLSIESTPVTDLSPITGLTALKQLNVAGTQIKSLKAIAGMQQLEELNIYNTRLRSLSPADKLPALKHLKCYNTRITRKNIDKLKQVRPELNILFY